jgi:hypothetical protein
MDYDAGQRAEALNIALRLRVLLSDTGKSVSVAQQADIKRAFEMYDSGMYEVTPGMAHSALTWGYGNTYLPCFDDFMDEGTRVFLPFERWWARKVMSDAEGHKLSRRKLILALANEGGGAHVIPDSGFGGAYADPERSNWAQTVFAVGGGPWQSVGSPVPAAVREMGYEALVSFARSYPETFGDDQLVPYYRELRTTRDVYRVEGTLSGAARIESEPALEPAGSTVPPGRNKP